MRHVMHVTLALLVCLLVGSYKLHAADKLKMIEGIVVSAEAGTLVVIDEKHQTHTLPVDSSAQIMVEGNMATLEDIQKGMKAHVTLDVGEVIAVNATKPMRDDDSCG